MDIKNRIIALRLNVKQHQAQIKILLNEIKVLEKYKISNSNDNSNNNLIDISNDNIIDNFCISNDNEKIIIKNENLNKFI